MARYWLPVDGEDDVFVHLSVRLEDIVDDIL
ncbi:cold shock CspA family protein [Pectinatus brassicae]|uniref:Cold shock CspA family protein n=1 Tax=Pectinatus brassicae TaxID=862415 RepID=A0A840UTX8_9FIRM|nr:cold shock CspA family protein [Pectinatus brassicae]